MSGEELEKLREARSKTFSPGPFKASQGTEDDPERWLVLADNGTQAFVIATVENGQPGDTMETEGHTARLFAAAPDLLAALDDVMLWIKNWSPMFTEENEWAATAALVEKAKAKVEGRAA